MAMASTVVRVRAGQSVGSGCYIGDRLVLTASHVFRGEGERATVQFRDGSEVTGQLLENSPEIDSAIIELDSEPTVQLPAVRLVSSPLEVGGICYRSGWGYLDRVSFTHARVLSMQGRNWVRLSAKAYGGDSGGPVWTSDGSLVGNIWGNGDGAWAVRSGPIRSLLSGLVGRVDEWKRGIGIGCLTPPPVTPPDQPPPPTPPTVVEIDYDILAAKVIELMAADPRFRGPPGLAGQNGADGIGLPGPAGPQGLPGTAGSIGDLRELADKIGPLLKPLLIQAGTRENPIGDPIEKKLGDTLYLQGYVVETPN